VAIQGVKPFVLHSANFLLDVSPRTLDTITGLPSLPGLPLHLSKRMIINGVSFQCARNADLFLECGVKIDISDFLNIINGDRGNHHSF